MFCVPRQEKKAGKSIQGVGHLARCPSAGGPACCCGVNARSPLPYAIHAPPPRVNKESPHDKEAAMATQKMMITRKAAAATAGHGERAGAVENALRCTGCRYGTARCVFPHLPTVSHPPSSTCARHRRGRRRPGKQPQPQEGSGRAAAPAAAPPAASTHGARQPCARSGAPAFERSVPLSKGQPRAGCRRRSPTACR